MLYPFNVWGALSLLATWLFIAWLKILKDMKKNSSTFSESFKKWFYKRKKRWIALSLLPIIYIITIFGLGYRIPGNDKHPDWPLFPNHSNKNMVIEKIENFDSIYGDRYKIPTPITPTDVYLFVDYYEKNVKNIKRIDFQIVYNEFDWGSRFRSGFSNTGGTVTPGYEPDPMKFDNYGFEYLELSIGESNTKFKFYDVHIKGTRLSNFYQYNYPKRKFDTLFFRFEEDNYKAYVK